ncbi:MAG: type II secretion system protein J, partial [Gammaproteobacteria bacterium]
MRAHRGFTLIEMITVLVVTGVLAISVWRAVAPQINGARDAAARAALVDYATIALTRMTREIALALPNS